MCERITAHLADGLSRLPPLRLKSESESSIEGPGEVTPKPLSEDQGSTGDPEKESGKSETEVAEVSRDDGEEATEPVSVHEKTADDEIRCRCNGH